MNNDDIGCARIINTNLQTLLHELKPYAVKHGWVLISESGDWDITCVYATPNGIEIIKGIRGEH